MTAVRTVYLETMGCQMNVLDSELVIGQLLARGYRLIDEMRRADLVILNTCSVRQHAEDKVYSRLGQLKASNGRRPDRIVAVIGCMAERDGDGLRRKAPHVDILCGPGELHRLPALIADVQETRRPAVALSGRLRTVSTPMRTLVEHDDLESLDSARAINEMRSVNGRYAQAYVRLTRGRNKWCTFCVVPMTRGSEVHRPPERIIDEVRRLVANGVVEVTLLGQTVNHYRYVDDRGRVTSFATLLRRVHDEVPDLPRLRFVTSFPRDFGDDALAAMAECPRICRYLHIPAQSGSNAVLRRMNRGYTVEEYRALLDRARELMPDIGLAGDMIVGFSGETEADFDATVELLRYARYKNCFVFKYSPRPGTLADERLPDDVPDEVKRRRNNDLLAVQAEINLAHHHALIGREVEVLVEGYSKAAIRAQESEQSRGGEVLLRAPSNGKARQLVGRTTGDQIVVFDGPPMLIGGFARVSILAATPYTLHGAVTDQPQPETDADRRGLIPTAEVAAPGRSLSLPLLGNAAR
jgi:tRNA-2-methylthio-N6-dimethylallyladenosine synthase